MSRKQDPHIAPFLSLQKLQIVNSYFDRINDNNWWEHDDISSWDNKTYEIQSMLSDMNRGCYKDMLGVLESIKNNIGDIFHTDNIYPDSFKFCIWRDGEEQSIHTDNNKDEYASWRQYSCIIYLNDDYSGGEIFFPELDIKFKPTAGDIVIFSSDLLHQVLKVGGERRTLMSFWSHDKSKRRYAL